MSPQERLELTGSPGQTCNGPRHHGDGPWIGPQRAAEQGGGSRPPANASAASSDEIRGVAKRTGPLRNGRFGDTRTRFAQNTRELAMLRTPGPERPDAPHEHGEKSRRCQD
jgi:hypothetical protein